jgi:hypothetical protein
MTTYLLGIYIPELYLQYSKLGAQIPAIPVQRGFRASPGQSEGGFEKARVRNTMGPEKLGLFIRPDWIEIRKPDYIENKSAIVTPAKYHDAIRIKSNLKFSKILLLKVQTILYQSV